MADQDYFSHAPILALVYAVKSALNGMKAVFALLAVAGLASCATLSPGQSVRDELLKANRQYDLALVAADTTALDRLYMDDFVFIGGLNVQKRDKRKQIEVMTSGNVKLLEGRSEDVEIRELGGVAILTGTFVGRARINNKEITFKELYSTVWMHDRGQWRLVLEHGSIVDSKP